VVEVPAASGSPKSQSQNVSRAITFAPDPMQFLMSDTADPNTRSGPKTCLTLLHTNIYSYLNNKSRKQWIPVRYLQLLPANGLDEY
jgi:hypothetical protein